jgi:uncharacterized protein
MAEEDMLGIPPLAETRHSRSGLLDALSSSEDLPAAEVAIATLYVHEVERDIVALLEKACHTDLDPPSAQLLFRGLHILGGRRRPEGFRALIAFLRGPQDRVEELLGDGVTETLTRILAGMFDGDPDLLIGLIADQSVDELVRDAAIDAFAFLAFDGPIEKPFALDFLRRFEAERMAPPGDAAWHTWGTAVCLLGLEPLSDHVRAACADGRISPAFADWEDLRPLLTAALERPEDAARFEDENLGYVEDVVAALEGFAAAGDDIGFDEPADDWLPPGDNQPVRNPLRHVGRNDPCPCGSGKKFKKCCLV